MTEPTLRPHPIPTGSVAICNDLDDTGTLGATAIQEFLSTRRAARAGPGPEVSNTFFPYTPDDSSHTTQPPWEAEILRLTRAGSVDCIHSFGDGVRTGLWR